MGKVHGYEVWYCEINRPKMLTHIDKLCFKDGRNLLETTYRSCNLFYHLSPCLRVKRTSPNRSCWSSVLIFSFPSRPVQKLDTSGTSKWLSESGCCVPLGKEGRTRLTDSCQTRQDALGRTLRSLPLERHSSNSQALVWCWDGAHI